MLALRVLTHSTHARPATFHAGSSRIHQMVQLSIQMFVKAIFQKVASVVQLRAVR